MHQFRAVFAQGGSSAMGCWNIILIILMFTFSSINVVLDWCNYADLSSETYRYGLVSGPPSQAQLQALLVFCIIGSVLYVIEILNMLSMLRNNGYPVLPVLWELGLVMAIENIPIGAINLAIVLCRFHQNTPLQIATTVFGILNIVIRFLALDTKEAKEKGIRPYNAALFVVLFMEWMAVLILCGFVWGQGYSQYKRDKIPEPGKQWLEGVSMLLLKDFHQGESNIRDLKITTLIQNQGLPIDNPFLVRNLSDIGNVYQTGYSVFYPCNSNAKEVPSQCGNVPGTKIHFRFRYMYNAPSTKTPLGDISYHYAYLYPNQECLPAESKLQSNWELYYLRVMLRTKGNRTVDVVASKPWKGACTVVHPIFDSSIDIC